MKYPSKAVGMINGSSSFSSTLIINVWANTTPVAHQNLLYQQHLVGLHCMKTTPKRVLVICLPQIEVDVTKQCNLRNKWITGTTSDAAGKLQPVKVSTTQIFHDFNKLACPYSNLPKAMKGSEIKKIPSTDSVLPLPGDGPMHMVSLPLEVLVSYTHGLQLGKVNNKDLRLDAEVYHPLMGLWSDMLTYQFSSATDLSGLTQKKSNVPNNQGFKSHEEGALQVVILLEDCDEDKPFIINIEQHLDMIKNLNIAAWLRDYPNSVDLDAVLPPRASKSHMLLHTRIPLHSFMTPLWLLQAPLHMEELLVTRSG
eukprot:12323342-Ditylum_brightwellii.AAC.1